MRRAFTLVELLVAVAVVALLVGLLVPALASAREAAKGGVCASQVRQLALANEAYGGDHSDRYAPGAAGIASSNLKRWYGSRASASAAFSSEGGALSAYLADDGTMSAALRECPAFAPMLGAKAPRSGFERSAGGYGYNNAFVGTSRRARDAFGVRVWEVESDLVGARRSVFRRPTMAAGFGDAALAADEVIEYSFIEPAFWPEFPASGGSRPDPSVHFRHRGRANIAWLDGHVSGEAMTHSESSGVYSLRAGDVNIGWFGDVSTNGSFAP